MSELAQTPQQVLLSGEGLSTMPLQQYRTLAKQLGNMGIEVSIYQGGEPDPAQDLTTKTDLAGFAEEHNYTEALVENVWTGLKAVYVENRDHDESDIDLPRRIRRHLGCPIQFVEQDIYSEADEPTPYHALGAIVTETLVPTLDWLYKHHLEGYGEKSKSYLAHYLNERVLSKDVFTVDHDPAKARVYTRAELPAEGEYAINTESPFLEAVSEGDRVAHLVTEKAMRGFAKNIGLKGVQTARLNQFIQSAVKVSLGPDIAEEVDAEVPRNSPKRPVSDEVWVVGATNGYSPKPVWGLQPKPLIRLVRKALQGEAGVYGVEGQTSGYIITHYIDAITTRT